MGIHILRVRISPIQTWYARSFLSAPGCAASSYQPSVRHISADLLTLSFLRFLARWPGWYGIAVLPYFSTSGKIPVTRCGLPLRGTYAVYLRSEPVGAPASPTMRVFAVSLPGGRLPFCPPLRYCRLKLLPPCAITVTCWNFGSVVCPNVPSGTHR